jgi:lactate dehydrogenase-like 2-hydroxyacid dehydrogenase
MPHSILQLGPPHRHLDAALAAAHDLTIVRLRDQADPDAFLASHGASFDIAVTTAVAGLSAATIRKLPSLRAVASFGVGFDTIDLAAATSAGIVVANTPGVLDDCVADLAMGLLLDVARRLSASDRFVRRGDWTRGAYPLGARVSGRKLGIAGLGNIGRAVARRAAGFDMKIRYMQRREATGLGHDHERHEYEPDLVALARWADFLVVAVAGGEGTRGLISRDVLHALGPQGYLINVSRGSVIDETALVEALEAGRIAGAGLDVFEHEPHVPTALLGRDDVVLLPHVGSATDATRTAMADLVVANVVRFVETGTLVTPIVLSR